MERVDQLRMTVLSALFAALIAVGAFIAIPIGPVPIVLQNFFVMVAGLLLGPRWGVISCGVYLLAGGCGLPVFAGGTGGLGRFLGPTGGYLLAYIPAVYIIGVISQLKKKSVVLDGSAMVVGSLVVYIMGVSWLKISTGMDWQKSIMVGMVPFLPGDLLKIVAAFVVVKTVRPMIDHYSGLHACRKRES